ncbi:type IV secretion protein Rhs [Cupriavidus sp. SK-4]|uniref:type VI secretion system Vgr family protein n=1 Tax=Cupriavidus sp. SK-4 TaxID=574750 RepID=UPI00044F7CEF|nr:type VI secretion system Vgr family protein [Cupriavidus sp. SK-4]EYS87919.1 type IV secretion protein Rhs [Cupriavidus sp. SK-4]
MGSRWLLAAATNPFSRVLAWVIVGHPSFRTVTVSGEGLPELLGQPLLVFSRLSGIEGINSLFAYDLELKTPDSRNVLYGPAGDFDMEAMQGKELTVSIELDGSGTGLPGGFGQGKREITGLVTDVRGPFHENERILYRLTLRPWLWLATLTSTFKRYQNMNVLEIVEAVLSNYIFPVERRLLDIQYPKREYQLQAGETDYQFVRRLLAEWGISFFFEHSNGHHRMVLTDGNGAFQNIPSPAYHTISWYPSSDRVDEEHLYQFAAHDRLVTGKWAHGDHDFKQPRADLNVSADDPRNTSHASYELYAWPGDHAEPMAGSDARAEGDMLARIRMEAIRQHGHRVRGKGNVRSMAAGHTFTLSRFLRKKANCEYLIFDTRLLIEDVGEFAGSGQQWRCEVEFEAQPTREIFRPEWVEKPYIGGTHIARVTGPANQEIWCDKWGRVRCEFSWDRYGNNDENSSCWIRVSNFASGDRFGNTHLPRIGQEVIVAYVGGDPDRPVIVGVINNQLNLPPWDLPSQLALSGYQSKELFGEGRNQTLYDDTQGQQQVQVASDHQSSLLALGHNVRVNDWEGRKDKRGEGYELRTDAHGALRAALGLLITTFSRLNAEGNAMNVRDVVQLLEKAQDIAATMGEKATEAQAQDGEQPDIAKKLETQNEQIKGGGDLKEFTAPHLVSASPAGIVSTAAGSTHIASCTDTALTTGEHLSITTGGGLFASVRKALRLFAYEAGMKLVANMGDIDLHALKNNINLLAKLKITATADEIVIQAKEKLLLAGGSSYLRLDGNIEHGTNGKFTVHAASKLLTGPNSIPTELSIRQVCLECLLKAAKRNTGLLLR